MITEKKKNKNAAVTNMTATALSLAELKFAFRREVE